MSWLFSQALVEEYSEGTSLDGAPCALSNGKPTQLPSWCSDKTMANCQLSQSGMTFKPLMEDLGEAVLMSFLAAFPVRTLAAPEKAKGSKETGHPCGNTWRESLEKFDLDTHTWKTHQCLWDEDLQPSSVILPKWGMMLDGVLWERTTLPRLTSGTESGLSESWPTASARDWKDSPGMARTGTNPDGTGRSREDQLARAVFAKQWPTPRCFMYKDALTDRGKSNLGEVVNETEGATKTGQLNPTWVEWLMGWPIGWTSMNNAQEVVWAFDCTCECGEDECKGECGCTTICPRCGGDYSNCRDIGPTEEGVRYEERDGILYGTRTDIDWRDWKTDPADEGELPRVATGIKHRVGRLKAIGNGQVPQVAAMAWNILSK